jgi:nicotinate-nucleotide adenylyltransferase
MREQVGLLGGSFNPIHIGHLIVARAVAEKLNLSRVILIPCSRPPHKWAHELTSISHRLEMARLAVADETALEVSDVEARQERLQYPIHAIEALRREMGSQTQLRWIIGSDAVLDLCHWHRLADMMEYCEITIATRAGIAMPDLRCLETALPPEQIAQLANGVVAAPHIEVSATQIRARIRARLSIRYLVPVAVDDYIRDEGLYQPRH